jgi:hypothetical protein
MKTSGRKPSRRTGQTPTKPGRGLPDPAHVVDVKSMTSPSGQKFQILRTNESDAYDPPQTPPPAKPTGKRKR